LNAGKVEEAIRLAEQAVTVAKTVGGIFADEVAQRVWGQALTQLTPPQWAEAEIHLLASLEACEMGDSLLEAARTQMALGQVCLSLGKLAEARENFEKAVEQFKASGREPEHTQAQTLLATLN
jgi:hypothetical protein